MQDRRSIVITSNRKKLVLAVNKILYVQMIGKNAEIHVAGDQVYETRMTLNEIQENLGEDFIKIHRGCIVASKVIYDITDTINLSNGETLMYTIRKKNQIITEFQERQRQIIRSFRKDGIPETDQEYQDCYRGFGRLPFAFTDIEMVFDENHKAVDWIFRYGNQALAELENVPLEQLIGSSFGSIFANMDSKWLRSYERAALYGEMLEIMDYSPEIDAYLKVICFPTFEGHCGCILFKISDIQLVQDSDDAEKALTLYFEKIRKFDDL